MILRINSPGGSPVQAGYINDEIRRLRAKYPKIPIYAVVEDICASGGYYIAVAADKIYVDKASIIGSIGVLMDGFGFTGTDGQSWASSAGCSRPGKTRGSSTRFRRSGNRRRNTPKRCSRDIHQQFIYRSAPGARQTSQGDPRNVFSGLVWIGQKSIELGLADAMGSVDYVARDVIKAEDIVDFTPRENIAERVARKFGAAMAETLVSALAGPSVAAALVCRVEQENASAAGRYPAALLSRPSATGRVSHHSRA